MLLGDIADKFELFPVVIVSVKSETNVMLGQDVITLADFLSAREFGTGECADSIERRTEPTVIFCCPARYDGIIEVGGKEVSVRANFQLYLFDNKIDTEDAHVVENETGFPVQSDWLAAEFILKMNDKLVEQLNQNGFSIKDGRRIDSVLKGTKEEIIALFVQAAKNSGMILPETAIELLSPVV